MAGRRFGHLRRGNGNGESTAARPASGGVCLTGAGVVRDGIVWDFFGAVTLVRRHPRPAPMNSSSAAALLTPGDLVPAGHRPRISRQRAGVCRVEVSHALLDEPTAVADLLALGIARRGGYWRRHPALPSSNGAGDLLADEAAGERHISGAGGAAATVFLEGGTVQAAMRRRFGQ